MATNPDKGFPCPPDCQCGRHHRQKSSEYLRKGKKFCTKCDAEKPLEQFDIHHEGVNGTVYHASCKRCRADVSYVFNRRRNFESQYGITVARYEELHEMQGGLCAICGEPEGKMQRGKVYMLSVDHDHVTGEVRGLLCNNCNRAIGLLKDNTDILKKAIRYLEVGGESDYG